MPVRAAGLRPSASHAADAARPWPCAANPAAMAIAKPEVIATQLVEPAAAAPVCANAGIARIEHLTCDKMPHCGDQRRTPGSAEDLVVLLRTDCTAICGSHRMGENRVDVVSWSADGWLQPHAHSPRAGGRRFIRFPGSDAVAIAGDTLLQRASSCD